MNKTLTIHLGRSIYPIDEDAFHLLDAFLKDYRSRYALDEADPKVSELEARIAELLSKKRDAGVLVMSTVEIKQVIEYLEKQLAAEARLVQVTADEDAAHQEQAAEDATDKAAADDESVHNESEASEGMKEEAAQEKAAVHKLYRNADDQWVGGVLSGIAEYTEWACAPLRLLWALFTLFYPQLVIVYIVAWILIPSKPLSYRKTGPKAATEGEASQPETTSKKDGPHGLAWFFSVLLKSLFILLAIIYIPAFLVLTFAFVSFILGSLGIMVTLPAFIYKVMPLTDFNISPTGGSMLAVSGVLLIGLPLIALVYAWLRHRGKVEKWSTTTFGILLALWIIAWVIAGIGFLIGVV